MVFTVFTISLLCLLSVLYLSLFAIDNAYAAGWGDDTDWGSEILYGIIVLLQCIFVVGLRLLGQKMIDPFGDDLEDLSVITYVEGTLENCRIILTPSKQIVEDVDDNANEEEDQKFSNRQTKVAAWANGRKQNTCQSRNSIMSNSDTESFDDDLSCSGGSQVVSTRRVD